MNKFKQLATISLALFITTNTFSAENNLSEKSLTKVISCESNSYEEAFKIGKIIEHTATRFTEKDYAKHNIPITTHGRVYELPFFITIAGKKTKTVSIFSEENLKSISLGALISSNNNPDEIEKIAKDKHIEDDLYQTNRFFKEKNSNEREYSTFLGDPKQLYVITNRYFYDLNGGVKKNTPILIFCKISK